MKYYEFKYNSKSQKNFEHFGYKLTLFLVPIGVGFLLWWVLLNTPLSNLPWFSILVYVIALASVGTGIFLTIRYQTQPKGVFLFDDHIDIDRQSITSLRYKMNYTIMIKDILYCKTTTEWSGKFGYDIMGGIGSEFVIIKTVDSKTFAFCIENQEEFINQVNKIRSDIFNKQNHNEI